MSRFHFYRPADEALTIWRYMDFPRFFSLISKNALYFHPAVLLREQEPFEFRYPQKHLTAVRVNLKRQLLDLGETEEQAEHLIRKITSQEGGLLDWAVNCWTARPLESYALWKTFVPNDDGVAIRSTIGRVKDSLDPTRLIFGGLVDYIDYLTEDFAPNEHSIGFEQIFHKARFYEHEQEFRIVANPEFEVGPCLVPDVFACPTTSTSLLVKADLTTLIEEVRISPYASAWFHNLVREFVADRFGKTLLVTESAIRSAHFLD